MRSGPGAVARLSLRAGRANELARARELLGSLFEARTAPPLRPFGRDSCRLSSPSAGLDEKRHDLDTLRPVRRTRL